MTLERSPEPRTSGKGSTLLLIAVVIVILAGGGAFFIFESSEKGSGEGQESPGASSESTSENRDTATVPEPGDTPHPATVSPSGEPNSAAGPSSLNGATSEPKDPDAAKLQKYSGVIANTLGESLAGVVIQSGPYTRPDEITATSDDEGAFTIELPVDQSPTVRMSHPGYFKQIVELERARELSIPYLLFRGGLIRGRVQGPIVVEGGDIKTQPTAGVLLEFAGMEGWFDEVTTDADGKYEITAPFGPVIITARTPLYRDEQILDVEASRKDIVEHDITLQPGIRLEAVLFGVGEAVGDAHVRVFTDLGLEGEGRSTPLGKATFDGLTPGQGKVVVVKSGYRAELHALVLGDNRPLVRRPISLDPSSPWSLEVVDSNGNARPDAMVRIRLDRIELVTAPAGDAKALDILGRDRHYQIDISAPDAPRTRVRFRIPTEGPPVLKVRLPRGGRIEGIVVDPNDRPIAGASILIAPTGGANSTQGPPRLTSTSLDGSFRTELFAPGPYRVQAHHPKIGRAAIDTRVIEGEDRDVGKIKVE